MKDSFRCVIRILTPVHIGCDEVYEPTSFWIDEDNMVLVAFSQYQFVSQLPGEKLKRFGEICRKGIVESLLEIYRFMRYLGLAGKKVTLCSGFVEHYRQTLSIPLGDRRRISSELNQFKIDRTAFLSNDERPYIPGSAVKGALRTSYLNQLASVKNVPQQRGRYAARQLEKLLLGGQFSTDPFRCVKVSDFKPVGKIKTRIIYAVNQKKQSSGTSARGPYQLLEIVEPGSLFEGQITIERPDRKAGIRQPVKAETLFKSLRFFYEKEKSREDAELERIGVSNFKWTNDGTRWLLRIGRHSGAECVTIGGHRSIKIKGQRRPADHATTFWLASDVRSPEIRKYLLPFGWVELNLVDEKLSARLEEMKKEGRTPEGTEVELHKEQVSAVAEKSLAPGSEPDVEKEKSKPDTSARTSLEKVWDEAFLNWTPQNQTLTAALKDQNLKATLVGKEKVMEIVPEQFHKKLFKKRKSVLARVTINQLGNRYEILKVEGK